MNLKLLITRFIPLIRSLSVFSFVVVLFIVPQSGVLTATPPNLEIEIVPSNLELGIGKIANVQIVIRNPSDQIASNLMLSTINNTSLSVSSEGVPIEELPPNAEAYWSLQVSQGQNNLDSGKIIIRIDYIWRDNNKPELKPVPRVLYGELSVTIPPIEPIEDIASVEVKSTLTAINEQRPGFIYIIMENKSGAPVRIQTITPTAPNFVEVVSLENVTDMILSSREKRTIPFQVRVTDIVQPGKIVLLFDIDLVWEKGGKTQTGTLITSQEIDIGVFGESQILTLLGIPAFFLLPGFLMIIAFRLLWSRNKTSEEAANFPLNAISSEFWFIAISLSLLMALLYPLVTNIIFGVRRNYLEGYGLIDVLNLWFGSILLAAFSYIAYSGSKILISRYRQKQVMERTPAEGDNPEETLKKLARNNLTMKRERILIQISEQDYWAFLLQDKTGDQKSYWVAPRIQIMNREDLDESLQTYVYDLIDKGTDIEAFLALVPKLRLRWEENWPESGPYQVSAADVKREELPQVMVDFY